MIQKCNFFLKGIEKFEVVMDHRPLIGIFAKNLPQIDNARITRLCKKILDRLFGVKWMAGKDNVIVDALSRAPASTTDDSEFEQKFWIIVLASECLCSSSTNDSCKDHRMM